MNNKWTPASKNPTVRDLHLVWLDDGLGNGFPFVAHWNGKEWEDLDSRHDILFPPVTHWMKIEPPTA